MQQALEAQRLLAETYGVRADVYSAPSFQLLRNEALEVEHWNLHNPGQERRVPYVTQVLAEPAAAGPVVAVSDWITAWPDIISRWVPTAAWRSLGTDGYGRSDTRRGAAALLRHRRCPHRDGRPRGAGAHGRLPAEQVAAWVAELDIQPEAPFALAR